MFSGTHASEGAVVLKLFSAQTEPERAIREVQAVTTVQCPRVPKIFEFGKVNSQVGELIWLREMRLDGQNLREHLRTGKLDGPSAMRLGLHVLEALTEAEKCRIVHRDVKPDNIFVDKKGTFWLLDFGLARHLDKDSLTAEQAAEAIHQASMGDPGDDGWVPTLIGGEQCRVREVVLLHK